MKRKLVTLLLVSIFVVEAQSQTLTSEQMLQDFDQAIDHINAFSVHKDLNAIRLGINYETEFAKIRNQIDSNTTDCEFKKILESATRLVQDLHCNFMGSEYLNQYGKYQKKINFKDDQTYERVEAFEKKCVDEPTTLRLPIMYTDGKYLIFSDFTYDSREVKRGTEITHYNGQEITNYLNENASRVWPMKWDDTHNKPYSLYFYRYATNEFELTLVDKESFTMKFSLYETIDHKTDQVREISYGSQSNNNVLYFAEEGILYIGLPFMDVPIAKSIIKKIDSVKSNKAVFDKIIIDVRGNPGGNDMCWRMLMEYLIADEIPLDSDLRFKYTPAALAYYGGKAKDITKIDVDLLGGMPYWTKSFSNNKLKPSRKSLKFTGTIFVFQDEFIFSSASNLSNLCLNSDQLISVGNTTDYVGGRQTEPLFIQLNNSGLVFRVEPMIDFTGVKELKDISHNEVEVKIDGSVEDLFLRSTYSGDIYGPDFLKSHDRLYQYVVSQ